MPPITPEIRIVILIITGIAAFLGTILTIRLEENLSFLVGHLIPQLRRKGKKQPKKLPLGVWMLFFSSIFISIFGTAIASSAPDLSQKEITPVQGIIKNLPTGTAASTFPATRVATVRPTITVTSTPRATPTLFASATRVAKQNGMIYHYVPAGKFIRGSNNGFPDEKPEHIVSLDAFWIAQTEVTNAMYRECVEATACKPPSGSDYFSRDASLPTYPVVFVTWYDAKSYCEWVGARLPTEAEWEKAARGPNGWVYPWGSQFECQRGNFDDEMGEDGQMIAGGQNCDGYNYIAPVGSFPGGRSVYGVQDLAGNVWEWVSDWYGDSYYYQYVKAQSLNPVGPEAGTRRVVKGGAWLNHVEMYFRGSNRYSYPPELADDNVGFRCVYSENTDALFEIE